MFRPGFEREASWEKEKRISGQTDKVYIDLLLRQILCLSGQTDNIASLSCTILELRACKSFPFLDHLPKRNFLS